jgi:hypothetical protein
VLCYVGQQLIKESWIRNREFDQRRPMAIIHRARTKHGAAFGMLALQAIEKVAN